jgi:hypothetical protein
MGSFGFVDVCLECSDRDDVVKVCDTYTDKLVPIFHDRNKALKNLKSNFKGETK